VGGRVADRGDVVDRDAEVAGGGDLLADEHEGHARGRGSEVILRQSHGGEDDAVDHLGGELVEGAPFAFGVAAGLGGDDGVAAALSLRFDELAQLGEVRLRELRHHEPHHPRAALAQSPRRDVGSVAELVDRREHLLARLRAHVNEVVDDVRDGARRDAGALGDVMEAGGHGNSWGWLWEPLYRCLQSS
jgi:hypothetical protein